MASHFPASGGCSGLPAHTSCDTIPRVEVYGGGVRDLGSISILLFRSHVRIFRVLSDLVQVSFLLYWDVGCCNYRCLPSLGRSAGVKGRCAFPSGYKYCRVPRRAASGQERTLHLRSSPGLREAGFQLDCHLHQDPHRPTDAYHHLLHQN